MEYPYCNKQTQVLTNWSVGKKPSKLTQAVQKKKLKDVECQSYDRDKLLKHVDCQTYRKFKAAEQLRVLHSDWDSQDDNNFYNKKSIKLASCSRYPTKHSAPSTCRHCCHYPHYDSSTKHKIRPYNVCQCNHEKTTAQLANYPYYDNTINKNEVKKFRESIETVYNNNNYSYDNALSEKSPFSVTYLFRPKKRIPRSPYYCRNERKFTPRTDSSFNMNKSPQFRELSVNTAFTRSSSRKDIVTEEEKDLRCTQYENYSETKSVITNRNKTRKYSKKDNCEFAKEIKRTIREKLNYCVNKKKKDIDCFCKCEKKIAKNKIKKCWKDTKETINELEQHTWPIDPKTCTHAYIYTLKEKPYLFLYEKYPTLYPCLINILKVRNAIKQYYSYITAVVCLCPIVVFGIYCGNCLLCGG